MEFWDDSAAADEDVAGDLGFVVDYCEDVLPHYEDLGRVDAVRTEFDVGVAFEVHYMITEYTVFV